MGLTRIRAEQISDIDYKQAVRVITLSNITLSGGAPAQVDGVSLSSGDRILVAGQTTGSQNGLYYVSTLGVGSNGTWTRTQDGNETGEIEAGMIVMVTEGTTYKDTQWKLTTNNPIVIGTTALTFEQNSAYAFGNIYANATAVVATSVGDTLTITAGNNISITGNNSSKSVTIGVTGISLNSISNGTSNVNVVSSGGNVTVGINGTNNVAVFGSATHTFAANLLPSANITYDLGTSTQRWRDLWLSNSTIYLGNSQISANATALTITNPAGGTTVLSGANSNLSVTTLSVSGNANVGNLGATNIVGTLTTAAQNNITSVGTLSSLSVTANVTGGNLLTGGLISATGNVNSGNLISAALVQGVTVSASGNITGGNLITSGALSVTGAAQAASYSASGNITGGNLLTAGIVSSTSNITGGNLLTGGLVSSTGNVTGGNFITAGILSVTNTANSSAANMTGALQVAGGGSFSKDLWVSGNIYAGNIVAVQANTLSVQDPLLYLTANTPYPYNYDIGFYSQFALTGNPPGNGYQHTGWIRKYTDNVWYLFSNVSTEPTNVVTLDANTVYDTMQSGSHIVIGYTTATGNVTGGNLITSGVITATGNIQGGNIRTAGQVSATGNITGGNILGGANVNATTLTGTTVSVTGNIDGGNLRTTGLISATGNITGGNILGNGASLTGINAFSNVTVTAGNSIVANSISSVLTLTGGNGISLIANTTTGAITIQTAATSSIFATGGDMGTTAEAVTSSEDLGLTSDSVTISYDLGSVVTSGVLYPDALILPNYTVAGLPSAVVAGSFVYVSNATGGSIPAFADGTNWRRVDDRSIVT